MVTKKVYFRPLAEKFDVEEDALLIPDSWGNEAKEDTGFSSSDSYAKSDPAIFTDPVSNPFDE